MVTRMITVERLVLVEEVSFGYQATVDVAVLKIYL